MHAKDQALLGGVLLVRDRLFLTRHTKALTTPRRIIQLIAAFPRVAEGAIAKPMPSPPTIKARMLAM
jgi:hypothetical protein